MKSLATIILLITTSLLAQDEINVTAAPIRKEIGPAGSQSVRFLESSPWLTVQSQGGRSAQLDLSVQGSSFSGAGLSLNGISFQNAQTEHFNAELPISGGILTAPLTSSGTEQLTRTAGHLIGTVDLETRSEYEDSIEVGAGTEDTLFVHLTCPFGDADNNGGALFFSHEETEALSFDDNYLEHTLGGAILTSSFSDISASLVLGYSTKDFGARGFYGVTPDWNAREEIVDQLAVASLSKEDGNSHWRVSAAWRRTEDEYTLYWTLPGTYINQHTTDFTAINADGASELTEKLKLIWRASASSDRIESESLGDHTRDSGSALLLPSLNAGKYTLSAGINPLMSSDEDSEILPVVSAACALTKDAHLYASYTETRRLPSYTELNYESPGSLGNEGLRSEYSHNYEAGVSFVAGDATIRFVGFLHDAKDSIDWTKDSPEAARWLASNLGDVNTAGLQCDLTGRYDPIEIYLSYIYLNRDFEDDFYPGRYVINYPEHCVVANVAAKATRQVTVYLNHEFRLQHEADFRAELDNSQVMADAGISWTPAVFDTARIDLSCENLWNDDFEIFPGQPPASRRYSIALQWYWN